MEEEVEDKDTKRKTRNLSEKKRRDQFNVLVNELSSIVSTNSRKMDKSTVLKATIAYLKNHNEFALRSRVHDVQADWKPSFLSNDEFAYLVLEAMEGFIMVFSATGRIYYVSDTTSALLGHNPVDVMGQNIFDLAFDTDRPHLYSLLQNPVTSVGSVQDVVLKENQIKFQCHIKRGELDLRNEISYELVLFNGFFRTNVEKREVEDLPGYSKEQDTRLLFICTGQLQTPQLIRDISLQEKIGQEFTSRHSLEWKFLFLDHRAPPIIGYLPFEVLGTSGYDYYHFDDMENVVACHEALIQKGELTSCYYRFLTKGQQWIWLQTRFFITYHQWNAKPEFVVCTHQVISSEQVAKSMKKEVVEGVIPEVEAAKDEVGVQESCVQEEDVSHDLLSNCFFSENSELFNPQPVSYPMSVKSMSGASTADTGCSGPAASALMSWTQAARCYASDNSLSGESHSSPWAHHREQNADLEINVEPMAPVPQHGIGAQFLEPLPYVAAMSTAPPAMTLSPMNVVITAAQAQIQEQLQRKHEELQQLIMQQQEELRRVSEQLVMARLGILPPLMNVPYQQEGLGQLQAMRHTYPQLQYEQSALPNYPQPQPPPGLPVPHLLQHPQHYGLQQQNLQSHAHHLQQLNMHPHHQLPQ